MQLQPADLTRGDTTVTNIRILIRLCLFVMLSVSLLGNNIGSAPITRAYEPSSPCPGKTGSPEAASLDNGTSRSAGVYVVGDVVKAFAYPGTPVRMLVWSARLREADPMLAKACQIAVTRVEKSDDFLAELQRCSAAMVMS